MLGQYPNRGNRLAISRSDEDALALRRAPVMLVFWIKRLIPGGSRQAFVIQNTINNLI